jgi:hypothetical protein
MERAAIERLQQKLDEQVKERFPDGAVQRLALLQYGDDPVIEPGELLVRVFIEAAGGPETYEQSLEAWEHKHKGIMKELRRELSERLPEARRLEVTFDDPTGPKPTMGMGLRSGGSLADIEERERAGGDLTPVMARLGPVDLETLDTLITAGIATNRAGAVRWALARIRERPAYGQLSERARELEELKAQF